MLIALFLSLSLNAYSAENKFDSEEILCERVPTAYLVDETRPSSNSANPCAATAKIQAIAYECGNTMNTYTTVQRFLKDNIRKAKEKCRAFCESVNKKCTGHLSDQTSCGFTVPTNRALDAGKNVVHCPAHCKGQAFNYCSLYHANYFSVDKELFEDKPMNCYCQKKN